MQRRPRPPSQSQGPSTWHVPHVVLPPSRSSSTIEPAQNDEFIEHRVALLKGQRDCEHLPPRAPPVTSRGPMNTPPPPVHKTHWGGFMDEIEAFIVRNKLDCSAAQQLREFAPHLRAPIVEADVVNCRNPSAVIVKRIQEVRHHMSYAKLNASESRRPAPVVVPPPSLGNLHTNDNHPPRVVPLPFNKKQPTQTEFAKPPPRTVPPPRPTQSKMVEENRPFPKPLVVPPPPLCRLNPEARSRSPRERTFWAHEELSYKAALRQVRGRDFRDWHVFCNKASGEYDPLFYPLTHLVAFLNGQEPPSSKFLKNISEFSKDELVARVAMAVKRGALPLGSHGRDPQRYSMNELRNYLEQHSTLFDHVVSNHQDGMHLPTSISEDLQYDPEIEPEDEIDLEDDLQRAVRASEELSRGGSMEWNGNFGRESQLLPDVLDSDENLPPLIPDDTEAEGTALDRLMAVD